MWGGGGGIVFGADVGDGNGLASYLHSEKLDGLCLLNILILLHSERPKLYRVLIVLSAIGLTEKNSDQIEVTLILSDDANAMTINYKTVMYCTMDNPNFLLKMIFRGI